MIYECAFDEFVGKRQIPENEWETNEEVVAWCWKFRNTYYAPEWLLDALGIQVRASLTEVYELERGRDRRARNKLFA